MLTTKDIRDGFEILRLCIGRFFSKLAIRFQSKSGPRSNKLHTPCGEFLVQSPPDYEDAQLISRIERKSTIGPVLSARAFEFESRHGFGRHGTKHKRSHKTCMGHNLFWTASIMQAADCIGATTDDMSEENSVYSGLQHPGNSWTSCKETL